MKRFIAIATASLLISAAGLVGCNKNDTAQNDKTDNRTAGEKTRDAVSNAGEKTGDALGSAVDKTRDAARTAADRTKAATQPSADAAISNTRDTLASAAEAAVTHDGLNDLVERFTKADRDRIGKLDKSTWGNLNSAVDKFRADWKAKYNQDFKLSDKEEVVFGTPVQIQVGDAAGGARLAADRTAPNDAAASANDKSMNNTTTVIFPAASGAPAVTLHLMNEGTITKSYKIDVPDSIDGNTLRDNLATHISAVDAMKDQWPSDVNQAARIVSQHIFAAVQDVK
jgi:hypothetical protein